MQNKQDVILKAFSDVNLKSMVKVVPIIVIYDKPKDYPSNFVARLWDINNKPTSYVVVADSLEEIRKLLPNNLTRIPRSEADDPVIIETYL